MFTFTESEFKQSRLYQSIKEECEEEIKLEAKLETKLETVPRLLALGLSAEQIAQALDLTVEQVQQAADNQSN